MRAYFIKLRSKRSYFTMTNTEGRSKLLCFKNPTDAVTFQEFLLEQRTNNGEYPMLDFQQSIESRKPQTTQTAEPPAPDEVEIEFLEESRMTQLMLSSTLGAVLCHEFSYTASLVSQTVNLQGQEMELDISETQLRQSLERLL